MECMYSSSVELVSNLFDNKVKEASTGAVSGGEFSGEKAFFLRFHIYCIRAPYTFSFHTAPHQEGRKKVL